MHDDSNCCYSLPNDSNVLASISVKDDRLSAALLLGSLRELCDVAVERLPGLDVFVEFKARVFVAHVEGGLLVEIASLMCDKVITLVVFSSTFLDSEPSVFALFLELILETSRYLLTFTLPRIIAGLVMVLGRIQRHSFHELRVLCVVDGDAVHFLATGIQAGDCNDGQIIHGLWGDDFSHKYRHRDTVRVYGEAEAVSQVPYVIRHYFLVLFDAEHCLEDVSRIVICPRHQCHRFLASFLSALVDFPDLAIPQQYDRSRIVPDMLTAPCLPSDDRKCFEAFRALHSGFSALSLT